MIVLNEGFSNPRVILERAYINSNGIIFLSTEHSDEVVESITSGIIDLTSQLKA